LQIIPIDVLQKYLNLSPDLLINNQEPNFRLFPNSMLSSEAFVAVIPNGRGWGDALTSAVMTLEGQYY
jgi:hypothetical protein